MNDRFLDKMAEERRQVIIIEMDQIKLEKLAAQDDVRQRPQPLLFRLGNGLVALGGRLRKRRAARRPDYWAVRNEMTADHR